MDFRTAINVAGVAGILGMYQFLHFKDPTFPSIFTLIAYVINFCAMALITGGGVYSVVQYLGMVQCLIKEDILGINTSIDRFKKVTTDDKFTEQDSDPEDPANYTSIG